MGRARWALITGVCQAACLAGCVVVPPDAVEIQPISAVSRPAPAASVRASSAPAPSASPFAPAPQPISPVVPLPVPVQAFATPGPVATTVAVGTTIVQVPVASPTAAPTAAPTATPVVVATPTPAPVVSSSPGATPTPTPTPRPTATPTPAPSPSTAERPDPLAVFRAGVQRDLAGVNQLRQFEGLYGSLTGGQKESVVQLLEQAAQPAERLFLLKALTAGESWANVTAYAQDMRGMSEDEIIRRSTMRDPDDLIQQWNDSCGPAMVQTIAGEIDPRYAWELNRQYDLAIVDVVGRNQALAEQQKEWLEAYGGVAVPRGATGGKGIGIADLLNGKLKPLVNAWYRVVDLNGDLDAGLNEIEATLKTGFDVPLRVSWSQPGDPDTGHFVLALYVEGQKGSRRYQIHDTFTGKTAWVTEANLRAHSIAPILSDYARLTHYYLAQPLD